MTPDAGFYLLAVPAVLLAGISKGGFGAGASFAATPLLALALPPGLAVGLMLPLLLVMDAVGLPAWWRRWDWRNARVMMLGAVPGVMLGAALFRWADADAIRVAIGVLALGFVAYRVALGLGWLKVARRPFSPLSAALAGLASGFTSFVTHAGGPPAAMHLLGQGLDRHRYQATTVLLFSWINLVKLPFYVAAGMITRDSVLAGAALAPVALLGVLAGVWLHRRMPERPFFIMIYALLAATGIKLIVDGLA